MTEIIIKWKSPESGQWAEIDAKQLLGQSLHNALYSFEGREVVCEVNIDGKKCYFCGTDAWVEHFKSKGDFAVKAGRGADYLKAKYPDIAETVFIPESVAGAIAILGLESVSSLQSGGTMPPTMLPDAPARHQSKSLTRQKDG